MEAKTDAHNPQPTRHGSDLSYYIVRVSNLNAWPVTSCHAAAYTLPYVLLAASGCGGWGAPALLLFGAVSTSPLAGVLSALSYDRYRITGYRYRCRIAEMVSRRYHRIDVDG